MTIEEFVVPFNIDRAPPFRSLLLRSRPYRHHLLLDIHHIIFDGISYDILIWELGQLYLREALHPLQLQFKDFAVWSSEQAKMDEVVALEMFWIEAFADPLVLDFPLDHRRGPETDFNGERIDFTLDFFTVDELKTLARAENVTLHTLLLAVFSVLLHKYTSQEDIIVGTPPCRPSAGGMQPYRRDVCQHSPCALRADPRQEFSPAGQGDPRPHVGNSGPPGTAARPNLRDSGHEPGSRT